MDFAADRAHRLFKKNSIALFPLTMRNRLMRQKLTPLLMAPLAAIALFGAGCAEANSAEQLKVPEISPTIASAASSALPVTGMTWDIQAEGSHIRFSAEQEGETFTGEFTEFSGTINFDPKAPETGSVDISIPLNSVDAGSQDRNSTLPGKVWFSVKKFPSARFTSAEISKQDTGFLAKGELTLKGKSLPIDLPFELQIVGDSAVMTGQAVLDRTLWNVGAAPWDTDEWVSRSVKLDIKVSAARAK